MHYSCKTRGIIIKRKRYQEADRILTVFSQDLGKIEVWARGVRKSKAKLQGQLGLFSLVKVEVVRGRRRDIVIGAETINTFSLLKEDFSKLVLVHFLAEFIDKFLPVGASDPKLYTLFRDIFLDLNKLSHRKAYLREFVLGELNILNFLGLKPRLDQCLGCGRKFDLPPHKSSAFAGIPKLGLGEGGIYCARCVKRGGAYTALIGQKTFELLREVKEVEEVKDLEEMNFALACFLSMALPQKPRALEWFDPTKTSFLRGAQGG